MDLLKVKHAVVIKRQFLLSNSQVLNMPNVPSKSHHSWNKIQTPGITVVVELQSLVEPGGIESVYRLVGAGED